MTDHITRLNTTLLFVKTLKNRLYLVNISGIQEFVAFSIKVLKNKSHINIGRRRTDHRKLDDEQRNITRDWTLPQKYKECTNLKENEI